MSDENNLNNLNSFKEPTPARKLTIYLQEATVIELQNMLSLITEKKPKGFAKLAIRIEKMLTKI